ncbi:MAG: glycosyltransferase [Alphaproteobacteria bacterium]|nr:glycosyltransferase [Alphaproteobacteria bacterium]
MHIAFLNPQGNFDEDDSYLAEHPDFGGQLVYVKEVAQSMCRLGHKVDIITRRMEDPDWPEFSAALDHYAGYEENLRIVRLDCGGPDFLNKEDLWPHLDEFVDNMLAFYGNNRPDFTTAHYADGGYCSARIQALTGIDFTLTGHSLGAQKLDKLGTNSGNWPEMEARFRFSRRIDAERLAMTRAYRIITSTEQEHSEQYSHPLYQGAVDVDEPGKFSVIPPGVNTRIFTTDKSEQDERVGNELPARLGENVDPFVLVSSRLDEKKNIIGVVKAFAESETLRQRARLAICIRGVDDPYRDIGHLPDTEKLVLREFLDVIDHANMADRVHYLNIHSQKELAATYRFLAKRGSVFALTAFYEPFGLAPIEAVACGLACVATQNGGPSEIFEDGSGILVDPFDADAIAGGLLTAIDNHADLSERARQRVLNMYTWDKTAEAYLGVIKKGVAAGRDAGADIPALNAEDRITEYLGNA